MGFISRRQKFVLAAVFAVFSAASAHAAPAQVLIIRHAEKPASGDDLSPAGFARARELVQYFERTPAVTQFGTPVAIYAMGFENGTSRRAVETVTPLAQALRLPVRSQYLKDQVAPLVREIMSTPAYAGRTVLICWEHNVIPQIAQEFGVRNAPGSWSEDDYWDVWRLVFTGNMVSHFDVFSQHLMPGDPAN
jgi:hypothetical protein